MPNAQISPARPQAPTALLACDLHIRQAYSLSPALTPDSGRENNLWQLTMSAQCRRPGCVWSLGQEEPLEKGMAIYFNSLAWRIPWTGEPVQSMGSQSQTTEQLPLFIMSTEKPDSNLWAGERPQTWDLPSSFGKQKRLSAHTCFFFFFLQDSEKAYCFKILPQEVWSSCTHRKSEIVSESLSRAMEGTCLLKVFSKDWRRWLVDH